MNSDIYFKKYLKYKVKYFKLRGGVDINRYTYGWGKNKNGINITMNDLKADPDVDYYIRKSNKDESFQLVNFIERKEKENLEKREVEKIYIFTDGSKRHYVKNIENIAIVKNTIVNRIRRDDKRVVPPK
jgi:hypothetical protein